MASVFILEGARTPFGNFCGGLKNISATELGVIASTEAMKRANLEPEEVDQIVFGNVIQSSTSAAYLARHIGLKSGIPQEKGACIVNRLCGSGMQAVISGAQSLLLGEGQTALVGGTENMSMSPFSNYHIRANGTRFGAVQLEDTLTETLTDQNTNTGMGITAENLAEKYKISREEQDDFAALSHHRAKDAANHGRFEKEIVAVSTPQGEVTYDEHIRPDTSVSKLSTLMPSFKKNGTVTAGNSSGINDGAASLVLAHEGFVRKRGLKPLAEIMSWAVVGVDPNYMGIGPVPASLLALQRAHLGIEDIDLIEINEAFAAQYLAVERELTLNWDRTNVNGGAIALGHPVGASGTRLLLTLAYELRERGLHYGLASLCIGGGQGIAMVIKAV